MRSRTERVGSETNVIRESSPLKQFLRKEIARLVLANPKMTSKEIFKIASANYRSKS